MQVFALIVDGFRESRDRKIFWVMLVLSIAVAAVLVTINFAPGQVTIAFGAWTIHADLFTRHGRVDPSLISSAVVHLVLDRILGSVGIILAIISTAGFLPGMMERGTIDVLLSKPLSRSKLFIGKYIGALTFIGFHATIFVLLTFLVMGLRWKIWLPGYLLAIPLMVLLFSYVYCVSALVAVISRSTVAAVLISIGSWSLFSGIQFASDLFYLEPALQEFEQAHTAAQIAPWLFPRTHAITYKAKHWSRAATSTNLVPNQDLTANDRKLLSRAEKIERRHMETPAIYTIGSSLLFESVIVALAMWRFSRRDY